jgi:hypothetical protein
MSTLRRRPRPGRRQCEQLLDGRARPGAGLDELAGLLRAARGPHGPGELPGEKAALAAFRTATAQPSPLVAAVPRAPGRSARGRHLVQILAAGAVTLAAGGVAVAATGTASLPGGHHGSATVTDPPTRPSGRPTTNPAGGTARATASGRPTALRPGLDERAALLVDCARWTRVHATAKSGDDDHADDLGGRELADLVKAAGGADETAAYCAALVEELCPDTRPGARGASPTAVPGAVPGCPKAGSVQTGRPGGTTSAPSSGQPSGQPSGKSSGQPTKLKTKGSKPATTPTSAVPSGGGEPATGQAPDSRPTSPAGDGDQH